MNDEPLPENEAQPQPAVGSSDWLAREIARGAHDHAFAEVPAGTMVTRELAQSLWQEHQRIGRKLTLEESLVVIQRANAKLTDAGAEERKESRE